MAITVDTALLYAACKAAAHVAADDDSILSGLRLHVDADSMVVSATNLDAYLTARVPIQERTEEEFFPVVVGNKPLLASLQALSGPLVVRPHASGELVLVRDDTTARFLPQWEDFRLFPSFPDPPQAVGTLSVRELARIERAASCASDIETAPTYGFVQILLDASGESIGVFATNKHIAWDGAPTPIPADTRAVAWLPDFASKTSDIVRGLGLKKASLVLCGGLIEGTAIRHGTYAGWETGPVTMLHPLPEVDPVQTAEVLDGAIRIMAKHVERPRGRVSARALLAAVRSVYPRVSKKKVTVIRLDMDGTAKTLTVTNQSAEKKTVHVIPYTGTTGGIRLQPVYLLNALQGLGKNDDILLEGRTHTSFGAHVVYALRLLRTDGDVTWISPVLTAQDKEYEAAMATARGFDCLACNTPAPFPCHDAGEDKDACDARKAVRAEYAARHAVTTP